MARTVTIEVTDEDITNGRPQEPYACPIYLAGKRAGLERLRVRSSTLDVYEGDRRMCIPLPLEAGYFVARFDRGGSVYPFSFTVELPD
jgi:hypothetical protein